MVNNKDLVSAKLTRWENYMRAFHIPAWSDIPDIGLYMDQVLTLLTQYLDYLPPELREEEFITAATVHNYVRRKIIPEPAGKKYYRRHLAYLIMICTLKHSLSIATLNNLIPVGISEEEVISEIMLTNSAIKNLLDPMDVAKVARFLCSDGADMITGTSIPVDGGWTAN